MASKHVVIIIYVLELIAASTLLSSFESLWNNRFLSPKVKIDENLRRKFLRLFILMICRIIVKAVYFYIEFYVKPMPVAYLIDFAMDFTYVLSLYFCFDLVLYLCGKNSKAIKAFAGVCGIIYSFGFMFISLIWLDPDMEDLLIPKGAASAAYILSELILLVPYLVIGVVITVNLIVNHRQYEYFAECFVLTVNNLWYIIYVHMWNFSYLDEKLYFLRILKPLDGLHFYMAVLLLLFWGVYIRQSRLMRNTKFSEEPAKEILPEAKTTIVEKEEEETNSEQSEIQRETVHEECTADEYQLTTREEEILELLIYGKSYQEIADELFISLNTVKRHCSHVYQKCGVKNRNQLTALMNTKNK